ncbi:pyridoxal phosphate-dependent aminotransferase [Streptosporangium lutulentum]
MNVTLSATLAANEEIERRRRASERVLHLAFGEAGLPVHPALRERLIAASERNGYGPVAGASELREAASGYWHRRGLPTDPELVVCGPGSKALLYGLLLAIGGDIVLPMPSWVSYAAQADLVGARPCSYRRPRRGGVPDPERVVSAVLRARSEGRQVRSLLVTLPDNPSGTLATANTIGRIVEVARELDLTIISDEIYRDLVHDPVATGFVSPADLAPERTVITSGLSKSLALGGWRIGVARLPSVGLRDRLLAVASEIWSSPAAPVQQAAAYAYTEPAELVARIDQSRRLHGTVVRAVHERFVLAGARVDAPRGGFYLYPHFDGLDFATSADLAAHLLDEYGVGVLASHVFGDDPGALRARVATSLLYGETTEQRTVTLNAPDPLGLPWISASLDHLSEALASLYAMRRAPLGYGPGRLVPAS